MCVSQNLKMIFHNQKCFIRIDCKCVKDVLLKNVKNITDTMKIFVQWRAILSVLYFDIEYYIYMGLLFWPLK